ncbi:hypothetical protein J1G33_20345 [Pseudomonas sp. P867]|uniref:hypothetical protein n=1 Tax=Pseudomonas sp. P867 TaxID=2816050 RepID=UPI001CA5FB6E|nr:hypothetical protein [Pseudomonas sp. P867]MBY8972746.1 hypothetical protein [Pseudomonas sp. P867]
MAGVGGIAAIMASWGIGLFEVKEKPLPPNLPVGQSVAAGEWCLRFDRASLSDHLPNGDVIQLGRKAIVLELQATNRTARTSSSFLQSIKLATPVSGVDAWPTAYLLRDRATTTELQPGLPEQIALVWTYPAAEHATAGVRFDVAAKNFKPFDNLYAQPIWTAPHPVGVVELPLAASRPDVSAGDL